MFVVDGVLDDAISGFGGITLDISFVDDESEGISVDVAKREFLNNVVILNVTNPIKVRDILKYE